MGSLAGHVLPGSLFLVYGLWWLFLSLWSHLSGVSSFYKQSKTKREGSTPGVVSFFEYKRDHSLSRRSWLPLPCTCTCRIPVEPIFKIVLSVIGVIAEAFFDVVPDEHGHSRLIATVYKPNDSDADFGKLHHITMYSAFALSGIIDIVSLFIKFPKHTSQIFLSLAFWTEGVLFYFHTGGRDALNVQIHFILTVIIFACGIFSLLRILQATNLLINVGLSCAIMLQGTWFIQAGYFLFGPSSKEESQKEDHHDTIMFVAACFTWHLLSVSLSVLALWVVLHLVRGSSIKHRLARRRLRARGPTQGWIDTEEQQRLINPQTGPANSQSIPVELEPVAETAT